MNSANTQPYVRMDDEDAPRGQPIVQQNKQQPQGLMTYHQPTNNILAQPPQQPQNQFQQMQQQQVAIQSISQPNRQIYTPSNYIQSMQPSQQQCPPSQYMVQLTAMNQANNINNPNQAPYFQGQWQQIPAPNPVFVPGNLQQGSLKIPSSRQPELFYCDFCKQTVNSKVIFKNGQGTYLAGFIIGLCGLWLGCCLIPCALDDCKDAQHICSNCGVDIGAKRFLFD